MVAKPPVSLPESIATKQDFMHVYRELQTFVDKQTQNSIRGKQDQSIEASTRLKDLALKNDIKLQDLAKCKGLLTSMEDIKESAPGVHLSFAVEPDEDILKKLALWFRQNSNSNVLIQVGLQPSIAAGVILRTPNKSFDFSLRTRLRENRDKLIEVLKNVK